MARARDFWEEWIAWPALTLVAFVAGVVGGVYYHNEIVAVWNGLPAAPPEASPGSIDSPETDLTSSVQSFIDLPNLAEQLPLVYSQTLDEPQIQQDLKRGAVVLPLGTAFGEKGNVVVIAHSSGTEAFGPYRTAFAELSKLEAGDEYMVTTPTARYTYRVYAKEIVWPHQVDKLPNDDRSTVTLVTCWPLWTNFQRLLVHTELIAVDYSI